MKYRPEIDGLRTLAVAPVVFYHAAIGPFHGGFAGVDVFFVISGYLITTILIDDLEAGTYSIIHFYERRARRILPALFLVCFCSGVAGWLFLFPAEFNEFGQSLVATSFFLSNVFFWLKSDYFATAAELKPLLHTWSLAVEEQFYILFPLFLAAIWAGIAAWRRCLWWLCAVAVVSFALCLWIGQGGNAVTFYMLPFRAWELLIGAIVAVILKRHAIAPRLLPGWLGLGLLAAALVLSSEGAWPSMLTLLPTLGTALIILFVRADGGVGRLLSWPPMVWGGLISYSLYLWHQPVLAFARNVSLDEPSVALRLGLIALSVLLAALSWVWVERPFRAGRGGAGIPRNTVFALSAGAIALAAAAGGSIDATDGWPDRRSFSGLTFAEIEGRLAGDRAEVLACGTELAVRAPPERPPDDCIFRPPGTADTGMTAIVIGDSHADILSGILRRMLTDRGYTVTVAPLRGCMPFPGFRTVNRDCDAANARIYDWIAADAYDVVVLAFRLPPWSEIAARFTLTGTTEGDARSGPATPDGIVALVETALRRLLADAGQVVVILPVPDMPVNVRHHVLRRGMFAAAPSDLAVETRFSEVRARQEPVRDLLRGLAPDRLHVVDGTAAFCDAARDRCMGVAEGRALYIDDNHLSALGVERLRPELARVFDRLD